MNNDSLHSAAFIGCLQGATGGRNPGVDTDPAFYAELMIRAREFADQMDAAIPAQNPGPTVPQVALLQGLCSGYWTNRSPNPKRLAHYTKLCAVLAAKYTEAKTKLVDIPGIGIALAGVSFKAKAEFPMIGDPIISIIPEAQTFGASYVGATVIAPGILQVEYALNNGIPDAVRFELTSISLAVIGALDPFIPVPVLLDPLTDTQVLQVVIANGSPQAPGSPDIIIEFHTAIYRTI
jgi:hypothetical protein